VDTRLAEALRGFRERYPGQEANWKRLEGWLLDHAPTEKRAVKALVSVPKLDLHLEMQRLSGRADAFAFRRMTDAITTQEGLAADLAEHAVLVWLSALGLEPPDATVLRGPFDNGVVAASLDAGRCLHLALVHSELPVVSQVRIEGLTNRALSELTVSIWVTGAEVGSALKSTTWSAPLERLRGRQMAIVDSVDVRIVKNALFEIRAPVAGRYWVEVRTRDELLLRTFHEVEVLPPRVWPMGRVPLPALAAFVLREDAVVAEIVGEAASRTAADDGRPPAVRALAALQATLAEMGIVVGASTNQGNGGAATSLVCSPRGLLRAGRGTPVDVQLLLAACLEHGGMPPLLVWSSAGPAIGVWTTPDRPALTETDDPELVARLVDAGALLLAPIGDEPLRLREADGAGFSALDVSAARRAGVLPLDSLVLGDGDAVAPAAAPVDGLRQRLLDRAALAGNRTGALLPGAWSARLARRADAADTTPPRLQQWKRRLLDLTLNNPLLNSKPRVTSLPLLVGDVGALEDSLAAGQVFRLDPRPPSGDVTPEMMRGAIAAGGLLVDLPERRVVTQAKNALRAFRAALDEGGVHTLFLTLGSLEWFEPGKPAEARRAPVLLVPVLIRRSRRGHYEIKKAESDTEMNAALLEFLRRERGVEVAGVDPLPLDHAGVDVAAVFTALRRSLASVPSTAGWQVREEAQIAVLSFSGFRMWRDLDHQAADVMRHPLVRRLALGESETEPVPFPEASTLDERLPARDVLCPLEADGSQLAAILAAAEGKSFVLEGPPGTGKSQTIANLVAQCIASGKSVLFVSQKRAALEVVEARLRAIGLGPFLLELHSKKASKPEFIQQLREAADFRARRPPRDWCAEADKLGAARDELNALVRALHRARDPGTSLYAAIAEAEANRGGPHLQPGKTVEFDPSRACEKSWIADARTALGDLVPSFLRLGEGWDELEPVRATDWPKARRDEVDQQLARVIDAALPLEEACRALEPWFEGLASASADDLELASVVVEQITKSPRPKLALLRDVDDRVEAWVARLEKARATAEATVTPRYVPALLEQPLEQQIARLRRWMGVFLIGWIVLALTVRWFLRGFAKAGLPPNAALLHDAEAAVALKAERAKLGVEAAEMTACLGQLELDAWGLPEVDAATVRAQIAFGKALRRRSVRFPKAIELAADDAPESANDPLGRFRAAYAHWTEVTRAGAATLDLAAGFARPAESAHLRVACARAAAIRARIPKLREWGAYRRNRDACLALGLGRVVRSLERGETGVATDAIVEAFTNAWRTWWIDHHVASEKQLAAFDGLKQRAREERFAELDRALRELASQEILARIAARQPRIDEGAPPTSQAGILLRQFGRRAGFASPRQIFADCAGLVRQLKPCVFMSPQSVAQYLDPSQPPFDVVVFDEASQVPTHEAIGAIARGRHVVVVGDSKQLPPTAFFLGQTRGDGADAGGQDEGDEVLSELDSILEECSASGLPSTRLSWHYRSRHPSLISFSNGRYYDGRLQVLPSAQARPNATLGVSLALVKGAVYDRGGTATNLVEARALVADLVSRLQSPDARRRSYGVVTFSRAQQALVEDLLEEARERTPEIERFFDPEQPEPVIVKNLENIQGDERDVVLFSIGYGPDVKGRMTANMGPLGQLGGERRLNVAVTRAREQLVVYVSFEPGMLDLSSTAARGLHDLKAFLESAAASDDVLVRAGREGLEPSDEPLKRALAARLESAGHSVDLDVGVGRWRVDLAVRDRLRPDIYALGIEVDGPRWAATDTARDRDRLRWQVLAGLGWRMYRLRALDWYEDADAVVTSMLAVLEEAARTGVGEQPAHADEPPPAAAPVVPDETTLPPPVVAPSAAGSPNDPHEPAPPSTAKALYRVSRAARPSGDFAWTHAQLPAILADIVRDEGPIAERLMCRRLADLWDLKRAPSGIERWAASIIARVPLEHRPLHRDGFFWPRGLEAHSWRAYRIPDPADPATRREPEDIPLEELANAAEHLLARYGQMPREDLARALAKRFGFRGLTRVVAQRVELGISHAESRAASSSSPGVGLTAPRS
jgi:very-short-patch-repair endonuclease